MAITNRDELINAMANNSSRIIIDKASIASQTVGTFCSVWRGTGQPGQGAIPTTAAVCNNTTVGAVQFAQQTSPSTSYIGIIESLTSNSGVMTLEIHDRLMHMGGLSGTVTTAQTVGIDINSNLATNNIDARKGDANFSDIQWWIEWYTATGATVTVATINVTYHDGTTGNLSTQSFAASRPAGHCIPINGLIPAGTNKYIRGVNTVTLSVTSGTAGNFGITATRYRAANMMPISNARYTSDWAALGIPEIMNESCLFPIMLCGASSSGTLRATGKIIHG